MRLTRPTLASSVVLPAFDPARDLVRNAMEASTEGDANALHGMPDLGVGHALLLPQSFG
jgi:hypothetical protein